MEIRLAGQPFMSSSMKGNYCRSNSDLIWMRNRGHVSWDQGPEKKI